MSATLSAEGLPIPAIGAVTGAIPAPASTNDIRGIRPPLEIPDRWAWVWWLVALAAVGVVGWILWRRWQRQRLAAPRVAALPPHVRARQRLEEAAQFISDPERFCTRVADTIRVYLEERFGLRAPERTTEEFLNELQASSHLTADQKRTLAEFLQSCDLVKFARFEPPETVLRQLLESALRLVDETWFDSLATPANAAPPSLPPAPPPPPSPAPESLTRV